MTKIKIIISAVVIIGASTFAISKSSLGKTVVAGCEVLSSQYNPHIMNARCGNLSQSDCCLIKNWWNTKNVLDSQIGQTGYSYRLYSAVGETDNNGKNIIQREFSGYCIEANWPAEDCKNKVSGLLSLYKQDEEVSSNQASQTQKQKDDAEQERLKKLGY